MMKKKVFLMIGLLLCLVCAGFTSNLSIDVQAATQVTFGRQPLVVKGAWQAQTHDLVYTVAFSSERQPNGPLVVYRALRGDQSTTVPVVALARGPAPLTPAFFPSSDGRSLALLTPLRNTSNGASLSVISTESGAQSLVLPSGAAVADQPVWSADNKALYYHSSTVHSIIMSGSNDYSIKGDKTEKKAYNGSVSAGYDEIHRVDLQGHNSVALYLVGGDHSLRMIGLDKTGALILTLARPQQPVSLLRIPAKSAPGQAHISKVDVITTLPADILPGNVLRVGSDGASVDCERVQSWQPLHYTVVNIAFRGGVAAQAVEPYNTYNTSSMMHILATSNDKNVQVMSRVLSLRTDLMAHGIPNVPAQEALLLLDKKSGATQQLTLPPGGQIVQAFWTKHIPLAHLHVVSPHLLTNLLTPSKLAKPDLGQNANPTQQDEWMLEAHGNNLADSPQLPTMCYGACSRGPVGNPHISAAILHGVAYTETNWHQFNTNDYRILNEAIGSPVKSFDGGWGEYQQTWAMPPQCNGAGNCRSDAARIQNSQSYNIGTGAQALIGAWNSTAGVSSKNATNDPYKANQWFFAVWAYNGSYGNNPNDVASSVYGHWYPGAPFRSIYEEYVWYYAAHPQSTTDNYLPSLGSSLLPPQSDFVGTSDSYVFCATCYIPDWTTSSYDREWVGMGTDAKTASYFKAAFDAGGGEDTMGLPHDNGAGAAVHRWESGWIQDFGGGPLQPGALMLADGTTTAYGLFGGIWMQYANVDHGAKGCHGYPTSAASAYKNAKIGTDDYKQQNFQKGSIVWDTTHKTVAQDVCV